MVDFHAEKEDVDEMEDFIIEEKEDVDKMELDFIIEETNKIIK